MDGGKALSFVSGGSDQPLLYRSVDDVLKAAVDQGPDRAALVAPFQSIRFTFAEFDREVERVARGMVACGLQPGERIGIWAPNCAEWILTMFGAARAGLILVNINPAYRSAELEFALLHGHASVADSGTCHRRAGPPHLRGLPRASPAGSVGHGTCGGHHLVQRPIGLRA